MVYGGLTMSKNSKWDDFIKEIFSQEGTFLPAKELIDLLCERAVDKKIIKNSHPFKFKNGQYIYMAINDNLNLQTLLKITKTYKPSMFRVLSLLNKEDNILSVYEARKAAATPVENIEKYKLTKLDEEIKELIKHDIICTVKDDEREITYIAAKELEKDPLLPSLLRRHFEKMRLDSMFLPDIIRWLKEHNIIDSNLSFYRRVDNPSIGTKHNDFLWDGYSYTNTTGFSINTGKVDKQTLVVLDVLIHREYSKEDLDAFYNRIQSVRNSTHGEARKILPIIFYVETNEEVKKEINRLKLLNFSLQNIFGTKLTELINKLDAINRALGKSLTLENHPEGVVEDVEKSLKLMDETGHLENFQNIKGDLFESLMYVVISNLFPYNSRTEHSKIIKPYEYDIIIQLDSEIIVIELKGFRNTTIINLGDNKTKNTVKWFFGKTFPHVKSAYTTPNTPFNYDKSKIKACYITSANFSKDAHEWLENTNKSKLKPEKIDCYYDRRALLNMIKTHENLSSLRHSTGFVDLLERYYLKET
jgi:hypothetical protein